jgi:two-component system NtrC family sensor kinase
MPKLADKVLVVDDDLNSLDLIAKQVLGPLGYQVIPVTDGGAAIQQAGKTSPDALIVSLSLRGFSGRDLLTALRSQGFEAPIIVIAPAGGEAQALAAFRLGARDYLVRPLREAEIVTVMDRVIGESRMRRERAQLQQQLTQANADMEQRLKEMTALSGLGKAVTNLSDVGLLFNRLVESALFVTGANMGWLLLADETTGQLTLHASKNLPVRVPLRRPWDDGLAPLVMMSGEPLNITGPGMNQFKISQVAKAVLVAPIRAREQTVGVLTVANAAAKPFNDRHQTLLGAVSDYASIAIVNVRLFQVLESRARSFQQAYDELKAGQKEKDELFEKLGADMRVPLGAAQQYVELALAEESSKLNNRLRNHLKLAAEKLNGATRVLEAIFSTKPSA